MMKVSHVLRGEDHIANTPRQIMILNALNLTHPQYGHLSLIVGDDGAPLSKRHGSYSLRELQELGYLPAAIINYLARLGHTCEAQELLAFDQLAQYFYLEKLSRSPARFDLSQLMYWQKIAVQTLDAPHFWRWVGEKIETQIPESAQPLFVETIKANVVFPKDVSMWASIFSTIIFPLKIANCKSYAMQGTIFVEAEQAVDKYGIDWQPILADMKQTLGISGKKLFMPLRIALTGKSHGPELTQIAELLGHEKMKKRFGRAFKMASERVG